MWKWNDPRWKDLVTDEMTYEDLRRKLDGVRHFNSSIDPTTLSATSVKSILSTCEARRGWGKAPENFRPVSEKEFSMSGFFTYTPEFTEYNQMRPDGKVWWWEEEEDYDGFVPNVKRKGAMISARLYYMHDSSGYAIARDYESESVTFFKFGCEHVWKITPRGNDTPRLFPNQHLYSCEECQRYKVVDSSD
jgi:hypothetical protein